MDSMVEENGGNSSVDPLDIGGTGNGTDTSGGGAGSGAQVEGAKSMHHQQQQQQQQQHHHQHHQSEFPANILTAHSPGLTVLKNSPSSNIVHLITTPSGGTLQSSVIQSSVIQANNVHGMTPTKVVYATSTPKGNSVIQAPGIKIKAEPYSSSAMQAMDSSDEDDSCSDDDAASRRRRDMLTRRPSYHKILKEISGPDMSVLSGPVVPEDQSRKREIRLQKNREAARECRRKKKEYIKCLENRVAVLENQNKALIEELKSLKELYCMTKTE